MSYSKAPLRCFLGKTSFSSPYWVSGAWKGCKLEHGLCVQGSSVRYIDLFKNRLFSLQIIIYYSVTYPDFHNYWRL